MIYISKTENQSRVNAFVVLLRDTTWKCGVVERLVVNYLRKQFPRCRYIQTSVKDMMDHFKMNEEDHRFFEAMDRLEKRGIIKIVSKSFSSSNDELNVVSRQGGA